MDNNKPESVLTVTPPPVPSDTEPVVAEFSNNSKLTELRVWSSGSTVLHIGNVIADELNDIRRKHDEESKENLGSLGENSSSSSSKTEPVIGLAPIAVTVENDVMNGDRVLVYDNKVVIDFNYGSNDIPYVMLASEIQADDCVTENYTLHDAQDDFNFKRVHISHIIYEEGSQLTQNNIVDVETLSNDIKFSIVEQPVFKYIFNDTPK